EIGNESLHKNQQAFAEAFRGRFDQKLLGKIKKRGPAVEAFFQEQLKTTLYARWETEHEAAEKAEKKENLLNAAKNHPLPPEWTSEDLNESQFMQKYFDLLADKDPELLEPQHQTMRAELFRDAELQSALKLRFRNYLEAKEEKVLDEAKNELEKMTFTDDEKRREEFHDNANAFADFVLAEKLTPGVRAKIDKLSPQKKAEYKDQLRQQAKG